MNARNILFGLSLALTSAVTAYASAYDKGSEQHVYGVETEVIRYENGSEQHVYSVETKVIPFENGSEQHVYSIETEVIPYEKQSGIAVDNSALIGRWQGAITMGDHEHPLTFQTRKDVGHGLSVTYKFSGMNFRAIESFEYRNSVNYDNGKVRFLIPDEGIQFDGRLVSSTLIEGTVDWNGRTQALRLEKMSPSEATDENIHGGTAHSMGSDKPLNVAILLFDGVDLLDWAGPLEVFNHAHNSFNTYTVAPVMKAYEDSSFQVYPKYTFANMPAADILIVPGGFVAPLFHQPEIMEWIKATSNQADITMSVCNAATVLARASLLDGLKATTHDSWMNWLDLQASEWNFTTVTGQRFVDNGKIVTTAGISAGIDGALHIVARLKGLAQARMAARMMEYDWQPDNIEQYYAVTSPVR